MLYGHPQGLDGAAVLISTRPMATHMDSRRTVVLLRTNKIVADTKIMDSLASTLLRLGACVSEDVRNAGLMSQSFGSVAAREIHAMPG